MFFFSLEVPTFKGLDGDTRNSHIMQYVDSESQRGVKVVAVMNMGYAYPWKHRRDTKKKSVYSLP